MVKNAILLAGGNGTRVQPLSQVVNKHLIPINNKFIIDYSLSTLKNLGVIDLTVVLGGAHFSQIVAYLKDGSDFGMNINFCYQDAPRGIAHGINLCKRFVKDEEQFFVMLGDNWFQNPVSFKKSKKSAQILLSSHYDLSGFGVATIHKNRIFKIEEKPQILNEKYESYAITGCYLFDQQFFKYFKILQPSARGEYEITDIINYYNNSKQLDYTIIDGDNAWSDAGTFDSIGYISDIIAGRL